MRNAEQNHVLGVFTHKEVSDDNKDNILKPIAEDDFKLEDLHGEVLTFPTNCPECNAPCETNMKMTSILNSMCNYILLYSNGGSCKYCLE